MHHTRCFNLACFMLQCNLSFSNFMLILCTFKITYFIIIFVMLGNYMLILDKYR